MKPAPISNSKHLLLLILTVCVVALGLYLVQTRIITPRQTNLKRLNLQETQRLEYAQNQLAARQAIDLPAMRTEVEKGREKLRTVQISGGSDDGVPFINSKALGDVAAFHGLISRQALASRLRIHRHASVTSATDSRLSDLLVRDLEVQGRFADIASFVEALKTLPHRIVILSLDLGPDVTMPGSLRVILRYSV